MRASDFDGPMTWLEVKILVSQWRLSGAMTTLYLIEIDEDVVTHAKHVPDPSSARRRVPRYLAPPSVFLHVGVALDFRRDLVFRMAYAPFLRLDTRSEP